MLRKMKFRSLKSRYGGISIKLLVLCSTCTAKELCTEILSLRIFSLIMMEIWRLAIWVWVASWVRKLLKHFQELGLLYIWVLKCFKAKVMIGNLMCGVWVVLRMNSLHSVLPSDLQTKKTLTCMSYFNVFLKVIFHLRQKDIVKNSEA